MNIFEKLTKLGNIKTAIKNAIASKQVEIDETTPFQDYPTLIRSIQGGNGGAIKDKLVVPPIITDEVTGTIEDSLTASPTFSNPIFDDYSVTTDEGTWTCYASQEAPPDSDGDYYAWGAFDGNIADDTTNWSSDNGTTFPVYIGMVFPELYPIYSIKYWGKKYVPAVNPSSLEIQARVSDQANWVTIYNSVTSQDELPDDEDESYTIYINDTTPYKECRLKINDSYHTYGVELRQIKFILGEENVIE